MHQGLTTKILYSLAFLLITWQGSQTNAQLNKSSEIIETIEDIQIQDDTQEQKPDDKQKPKFDEEFQKGSTSEESIEEEIQEMDSEEKEQLAEPEEEKAKETVERKELKEGDQTRYEEELEKNADKNKLKRGEGLEEEADQFEVDPSEKEAVTEEAPKAEPTKEAPKTAEPQPEPTEDPTRQYPVGEEEQSADMNYIPAPSTEKTISKEEADRLTEKTDVEIEEDPYLDPIAERKRLRDLLKPYAERRGSWGLQFEIGSTQYEPTNYVSDVIVAQNALDTYDTFYEASDIPLSGLGLEVKKNFSFGAIGVSGLFTYFSASNDVAEFKLMVPELKATLYLDTLFKEPYVVPYASGGYAYFMYEESFNDGALEPIDLDGVTDNFFFSLGVEFQLDWLDPTAARSAYTDSGIENSFIFVEGKSFLDQGIMRANDDPDFSSELFISAGARVEF